ncbi:MAG: transposase [Thermoanaerobaculaceae bacterium]|jgi:REP element-mobilizing transposase RayT|nr:transposase [Thermoanaerobaculaceae bacterium]
MPRQARVFVPGAAYHVYCRAARGERPFADDTVAARFVETLAAVKAEHGLTILAWCLMPNHYHLVLRSGVLPLWRSMRLLQGRFAKAFNRRQGVLGPLWQGRYKARSIEDAPYLMQAIAYVHLNPVASGMMADPAAWRWSGYRQLLGRARTGLVDVSEALLVFGSTLRAARAAYRTILGRGRDEGWMGDMPGELPWWRRAGAADQVLQPDPARPRLDWLGLAQLPAPVRLGTGELVSRVAAEVGVSPAALAGRGQTAALTRARELVMLLGVEVCNLKVKDLGESLGRNAGSASRLYGAAVGRRRDDPEFAARVQMVQANLQPSVPVARDRR